jgi:hypothetical protein
VSHEVISEVLLTAPVIVPRRFGSFVVPYCCLGILEPEDVIATLRNVGIHPVSQRKTFIFCG